MDEDDEENEAADEDEEDVEQRPAAKLRHPLQVAPADVRAHRQHECVEAHQHHRVQDPSDDLQIRVRSLETVPPLHVSDGVPVARLLRQRPHRLRPVRTAASDSCYL